ncbi:MAG TPA: isoprenylcysteine carboxylmethyltransferase family protein [Candidatus Acidoferrales bacterium]|jgi:protein-S-isoprenylcysteine O-methyltransferase Ste14|nr:isoprenylcysteine carboxylmethyltransferase family protein [Candidatus Acidoferrales bacterium]
MSLFGWLAAVVLFLQLPIPIYWFVVHPFGAFWRRRRGAAFAAGLLVSWPPVTAFLLFYRRSLFRAEGPSVAAAVVGVLLILFEIWIFQRVGRDLGAARLVGKTELSGSGELAERGIYGRIRHPRYAGSFLAVIGASLLAGSRVVWIVAAVWAGLMFVAILMEEKELAGRFGDAYRDYCRRVPRFIPEWRGVAKLQ